MLFIIILTHSHNFVTFFIFKICLDNMAMQHDK